MYETVHMTCLVCEQVLQYQEELDMQKDEIKNYIEAFKKRTQTICKSKESAASYLIKAGIHTSSGNLTENYSQKKWCMYSRKISPIIGFHGCSTQVREKILSGDDELKASSNDYDWLGPGMYFWENNYDRAKAWSQANFGNDAAVLGAIIDLGNCLDFLESKYLSLLRPAYQRLKRLSEKADFAMPVNRDAAGNSDKIVRRLDCAVIKMIHEDIEESGCLPFDSVRGVFWEGSSPYEGEMFKEQNHIQLSIMNSNCIKGYFRPRQLNPNRTNP